MKTRLENFTIAELLDLSIGISVLLRTVPTALNEHEISSNEIFSIQKVAEFQATILLELSCRIPEDVQGLGAIFPSENILEGDQKNDKS